MPSFPPEAQRDPSGETQTVLRYPVWPTRSLRSLQLVRLHTLTSRSHPQDTMSGTAWEGENLTQDTHSECPSSPPDPMVYLHSPRVFHSLMVLSRDPDTICRLSAEKATDSTSLECPMKRRVVLPEWISHSRSVPSQLPDRANCPSEEITTSDTLFFCFFSVIFH